MKLKNKILFLLPLISILFSVRANAGDLENIWKQRIEGGILTTAVNTTPIVVTQKEIIFMDEKGAIVNTIPLNENQFAVISRDTNTFTLVTHRPHIKEIIQKTELFISSALLSCSTSSSSSTLSSCGLTAGSITPLCTIEENGYPYLSPDGTWLAMISKPKSKISFYTKEGKKLREYDFPNIKNSALAFSGDSRYCAINTSNIQGNETGSRVILFNDKGKKIWQYDHPRSTAGELNLSQNGETVVYSSENELISINKKGRENWTKSLTPGGIKTALSPNQKYLAISRREDNSITLYNAQDGTEIWKKQITGLLGYNSPFTSLEVLDNGAVITAIAKSWSIRNDQSYLYIIKDKQIASYTEFTAPWIKAITKNDNRHIIVYSKEFVEKYMK